MPAPEPPDLVRGQAPLPPPPLPQAPLQAEQIHFPHSAPHPKPGFWDPMTAFSEADTSLRLKRERNE